MSVGGGFTVHRMTSSLGHKTGRSSHADKDRGNALELLASVSVRVRKKNVYIILNIDINIIYIIYKTSLD